MQFKTKLLLTRLITFLLLMMVMVFAYHIAISQYSEQIDNDIAYEIAAKQQNITNIISIALQNKQRNTGLYSQVHQKALDLYNNSVDKNLEKIRQDLINEFGISQDSLHLFLINRDKVIYKATLAKDVGYDLSNYSEPAQMIDSAFANNDIHISSSVSQDVLDASYKTFSYAKVTDDIILELSFVDDSASGVFRFAQRQSEDQHMKATLYTVYNEGDDYFYFRTDDNFSYKNKKEAYESAPKFNQSNYKSNPIISAFLTKKPVSFEDNNVLSYYSNLFSEPKLETEFENIVVKYEVSLQERESFLQLIKRFFLAICVLVGMVMLIIHWFINKQLVRPVNMITSHIRKRGLIPIDELNNQSDEFYIISKEYNNVYTELHKEIEKNASKVYIDSLTQAGNRQAFDEELEKLIKIFDSKQFHFTMMLFDVDNFKNINDNFGHFTGDKVLQEISQLVKDTIRNKDTFYRVGGEEFVILLTDTRLDDAIEVAERVRINIASHFSTWETGEITISAGVCEMSIGGTYESLYKCVDSMLYKAKSEGKNRVYSISGCETN